MACANRKQQPSSLVEDFNSLNLFGKCQPEDLIFNAHEEKEKEQKFIQAQKEREQELKRQAQKKKEEEIAYREFLKEAQEKEFRKRNGVYYYTPPKARGRGSLLSGAVNGGIGETKPRGRGRLSPQEIAGLPLFERMQKVQKNLQQFSESSLHNNAVQKLYWTGLQLNKEEEDYDHFTADSNTSFTDSSSTSDQYEDAESSHTSSPQSFNSVPSRSSGSPTSAASPGLELPVFNNLSPLQPQTRPEVASSSPRPRKPRASRLAAKFSNSVEEEDNVNEKENINEETLNHKIEEKYTSEEAVGVASVIEEDREDPLAVLGSSRPSLAPFKYRMGRRSVGTSFNSLHPSQRVLSNNVLRPEELYYAKAGASKDFTLNLNDFPAL